MITCTSHACEREAAYIVWWPGKGIGSGPEHLPPLLCPLCADRARGIARHLGIVLRLDNVEHVPLVVAAIERERAQGAP